MTPRLVARSAAEADIAEAAFWYEQRATGLGAEFLWAVDAAVTEILNMPQGFPDVHLGCRRALTHRFPYAVYYAATPECISVIACLHVGRDPRVWEERA